MNTYIFLLTSMALFLVQLFVYLMIFYICAVIVGYPIKIFFHRFKQLLRRGGQFT